MKVNSEVRYASHPNDAKHYDTAQLRQHYLMETVFAADEINITAMLLDHEMRLQTLEKGSGNGAGADAPLEEYTVGTPTVAGNRWLWKGVEYEVVNATPENPCVWSPEGYPYYWRRVG